MNKIVSAFALIVTLLAAAVPAHADFKNWRDRQSQIRDFFECAYTPALHFDGTIVDAAIATDELSDLADAVIAAGLVETLSGEGPFTVYAPINSAFAAIPDSILNGVLSVTDEEGNLVGLQAVLTYHVALGAGFRNDPRRVFNTRISQIDTVLGQQLFFSRDREGTEINQSNLVSCQPVRTNNGVVYLIDSVFLPQF
jgi:uncharacterized surface protein with fasciclin (FAS1) repeats